MEELHRIAPHRITIICGHYGCGKTNLALNLALSAAQTREVTLVDLDIVNPYFRSSEYRELLEGEGIRLISPVFANSTLDAPALPPDIYSVLDRRTGKVFIDAGGDDAGVTALGRLSDGLREVGYDMLYVINRYRALSQKPQEAAELLREIEAAARLRATGIVNNSHLGTESRMEDIEASLDFAAETSKLTGLPLLCSTVPDFALNTQALPEGFVKVKRLVKSPWE